MSLDPSLFEILGDFYLGRRLDESGQATDVPLLYDARDLRTHALMVGMTGSGKTGLMTTLIEEAALDGIPSLVVDPKGDLGNLLLTFPDLAADDFQPWVDPSEAAAADRTVEEHAEHVATTWRRGLASWGQSPDRVRRLRAAADFTLYTPGSSAGVPLSLLSSFAVPPPEISDDDELLHQRVASTVSGLLGLLGIEADPVSGRETIFLSALFDHAWRGGEALDLASLIHQVQAPPLERLGVLPIDSFFPEKDRFGLATALNNLLASPGFRVWREGAPLDIDALLFGPDGSPRVSVLSIAHLDERERMFFLTLLLEEVLGWMRTRSGTAGLRAILAIDEIFGYLPPTAMPPSKRPLLTLLKQARAYGLGLVLATQNPVDLDYKALSNIGSWFLGRLQTERDKARLMDGLLAADGGPDRATLETLLSGLGKRTFLLHDIHEPGPTLFTVRWAMSYLRGPLTRDEIRRLRPADDSTERPAEPEDAADSTRDEASTPSPTSAPRPVLPSGIDEVFARPEPGAEDVVYRPYAFGEARVRFVHKKLGFEVEDELVHIVPLAGDDAYEGGPLDWRDATSLDRRRLESEPIVGAAFAPLPSAAGDARTVRSWKKHFSDHLYRDRRYALPRHEGLDLVGQPGESDRDFRVRIAEAARAWRDEEADDLRERFGRKIERERDQLLRAEQRVEAEREQAREQKVQVGLRVLETLAGSLFGGRRRSLSTTARRVQRSVREAGDVRRAEERLAAEEADLEQLETELRDALEDLERTFETLRDEDLTTFELAPRRIDVDVRRVGIAWIPRA